MPIIIAVDVSMSMGAVAEQAGSDSKLKLVVEGLNTFLDYINSRQKLEFISLVAFSHKCDVIVPFTRDISLIKDKLISLTISNSSAELNPAVSTISEHFLSEWDTDFSCNVLLITQGNLIFSPIFQLILPFTANIMLVLINSGPVPDSLNALVNASPHKCKIYHPQAPFIPVSFHLMFYQMCEEHFAPWIGSLNFGNLNSKIVISPNPKPYTKVGDFDTVTYNIDPVIEICGFIDIQDIGTPGAVSRHLVLPLSSSTTALPFEIPKFDNLNSQIFLSKVGMSASSSQNSHSSTVLSDSKMTLDDDTSGEGYLPSFCVLLHGALKVENMAALCYLGRDWYGVLYSWADSKKKSNLMLSLLEPGPEPVPWLGNLNNLAIPSPEDVALCDSFPVKPLVKRPLIPNPSSWIRQSGLQGDIQKILRHARKIPEKTANFFKELNRVRKAALSIGFYQLLHGLAAVLERECTLLPGTTHPACALQLSHASSVLKEPISMDPRYTIQPLKMSF